LTQGGRLTELARRAQGGRMRGSAQSNYLELYDARKAAADLV
jgi:hypothetical protein